MVGLVKTDQLYNFLRIIVRCNRIDHSCAAPPALVQNTLLPFFDLKTNGLKYALTRILPVTGIHINMKREKTPAAMIPTA